MGSLSPWHGIILLFWILIPVICGFVASMIAKKKNRSAGGFFALGFFLGIIGIIVAAVVAPGETPPPVGMRAVKCSRCNARQNVAVRDRTFECWQCKTVSEAAA